MKREGKETDEASKKEMKRDADVSSLALTLYLTGHLLKLTLSSI